MLFIFRSVLFCIIGYVLKSCKKYSDSFGDLINVDV